MDVQRRLARRRLEVEQAERAAGLVAARLDGHENLQVPDGIAALLVEGEELVGHSGHLLPIPDQTWAAATCDPPKTAAKSAANCLNDRALCPETSAKSLVTKSPQPWE